MKPMDFYKKEFIKDRSKSRKRSITGDNANFPFYNWMSFLNDASVPRDEEIARLQLLNIKYNFPVNTSMMKWYNQNGNFINEFKNSKINDDFTTEEGIALIEKLFNKLIFNENTKSWDYNENPSILANRINKNTSNLEKYEEVKNNLEKLISIIKSQPSSFINTKEIEGIISKIDNAYNLLSADLDASKNNYQFAEESNSGYFGEWKNIEKRGGKIKTSKYGEISYIGKKLKSRLFEDHFNNFYSKIISNVEDVSVLDTSTILTGSFDLLGNTKQNKGKQARQDTLVFDNTIDIMKGIKVKYTYKGKVRNKTLEHFIEDCNKAQNMHETISISNKGWDKVIEAASHGIQEKSGIGQYPFNSFSITPNQAITVAQNCAHARSLSAMITWYSYGHIYANHQYFNAWFNYCFSHDMSRVIGKGNNFLALRDYFGPTYKYFEDQWNSHRKYVQALNKVSVANDGNRSSSVNLTNKKLF